MKTLFTQAQVIDSQSTWSGQCVDILVEDGKIAAIGSDLPKQAQQIACEGLYLSPGFFDSNSTLQDPGFEYKNTFQQLVQSAMRGGYTTLSCISGTAPPLQDRAALQHVTTRSHGSLIQVYPIAVLTKEQGGEEMVDYLDLTQAGASAFFDGFKSMPDIGLLKRILEYLRPYKGLVMLSPISTTLGHKGQMHEGLTSTLLGTPGFPAISEWTVVRQVLDLLEYTGGRVHFTGVSTGRSVQEIARAKQAGLQVTCDVAWYSLYFQDTDLATYDTHLKAYPPVRSLGDQEALIQGLQDGTVEAITSCHIPQDIESKDLEFELAEFGMLGLETAFAASFTALKDKVELTRLIDLFTSGPRSIFNRELSITQGQPAEFTLFDTTAWKVTEQEIAAGSKNTPMLGRELQGRIHSLYTKQQHHVIR